MHICTRCGLAHPAQSACPIACALPVPAANLLAVGDVVGGRFRIDAVAHRSGMSTVYRADDLRNQGTVVALKELHTADLPAAERAESLAWLAREAALLSTLNHPGLPRLLAAFSEGDRHYLAMPFLNGETLEDRAEREGPQGEAVVLGWGRELVALLRYMHDQDPPVIHRDLKPANILLRPEGNLVLLDLGVARRVARDGQGALAGTAVGTPGYAAPEQYQGLADERSDLYSLGATLHRLLTSYQPDEEAPFRHPPLHTLAPDACPETGALLAALLDLAPERRAGSAGALALLDGAIWRAHDRAYLPLRRAYMEMLALLPIALALSGLPYVWRYGLPPDGPGAYRDLDSIGEPLAVVLLFSPLLLALLPLLRPGFRALARSDPQFTLHRRWTTTLLIFCWALPLFACLLNLYLMRWGNLTPEPGLSALALALCCAMVAMIGVLILRLAVMKRRPLPSAPHWWYALAAALIAALPLSSLSRSPAALGFCYVASSQPGASGMYGGISSLAADSRGDLFVLDQNSLQERTPDGIYHPLLDNSYLNDGAVPIRALNSLAATADGSMLILGALGDSRLYRLSRADTAPQAIVTIPGQGLPDNARLAIGPMALSTTTMRKEVPSTE